MTEPERKAMMARLLAANPQLASAGVMTLGHLLADFLKDAVADPETAVDTGCGFGEFDLWVKLDGEEYHVGVKKVGAPAP